MSDIAERLTEYLLHGGLYNPELMQHDKVRDLLIDCRDEIAAEIEQLREAIRSLADQDATLSVQDGSVTVTMDATLTDEEREAVAWAAEVRKPLTRLTQSHNREKYKDTLRGLLERLK
jgi:hypothetical protein